MSEEPRSGGTGAGGTGSGKADGGAAGRGSADGGTRAELYGELASAGPYGVRPGHALITMVEPHPGHEFAYNRWYEDDHFYSRRHGHALDLLGPPLGRHP